MLADGHFKDIFSIFQKLPLLLRLLRWWPTVFCSNVKSVVTLLLKIQVHALLYTDLTLTRASFFHLHFKRKLQLPGMFFIFFHHKLADKCWKQKTKTKKSDTTATNIKRAIRLPPTVILPTWWLVKIFNKESNYSYQAILKCKFYIHYTIRIS